MKKLPFVQRLRESPAGVLVPFVPGEGRRPFRLWMTGSLAVVMAAMIPLRDVSESEREHTMRVLRHSRFGVTETVQRIEAAARGQGLSVLALMAGARPVLVLASSVGGTPVLMHDADSQPAMPLSLMVREGGGGGADVLVAATSVARASQVWHELPAAVLDDLDALPGLVERALL
jgi:uncharacterized protein (DUF302 family)